MRRLIAVSTIAAFLLVWWFACHAQAGKFDLTSKTKVEVKHRFNLSSPAGRREVTVEKKVEHVAGPAPAPAYRIECAGGVCRRVEVGPAAKSEPIRLWRPLLRWRLR